MQKDRQDMRNRFSLSVSLALAVLMAAPLLSGPAAAAGGDYEVMGVAADDMLKMRSGPGTGYRVLVGLPNGTEVRLLNCEQSGGTRWCKVSLKLARGLRGWVSFGYLRKL